MEEWLPQTTTFLMCSVLAPSFLAAWEDVVCIVWEEEGALVLYFTLIPVLEILD